jgi:TRAP-type C4-dicarboxylate transport system permease small subunit
MRRILLVLIYLAAAAFAVVLFDAHTENEQLETVALALWGIASLLLGWGTGQPVWSLLVVGVVALAIPFGEQNPPVYHEAAFTVIYASIFGIASAALIVISALARMIVGQYTGRQVDRFGKAP